MTSFGWQILIALVLGVLLGSLAAAMGGDPEENPNWLMTTLDTIGTSYVTILKAAVVPLVDGRSLAAGAAHKPAG